MEQTRELSIGAVIQCWNSARPENYPGLMINNLEVVNEVDEKVKAEG